MTKYFTVIICLGFLFGTACNQKKEIKTEAPVKQEKPVKQDLTKPDPQAFTPSNTNIDSSSRILFTKATNLVDLKKYAEGIQIIDQYIQKNPTDANAYFVKGYARDQSEDYTGAIKDFAEALKLKPEHIYTMMYKGHSHLYLNQFPEAFELFTRVIKKEPDNMLAYYNRGLALSKLNKYKEAVEDFSTALKIDSTYGPAYNNRGNAKYLAGDADGACMDWKTSIRLGNIASEKAYKYYCEGDKAIKRNTPPIQESKKKK
jgi:tetratricopeptide (TPR) repeat protein